MKNIKEIKTTEELMSIFLVSDDLYNKRMNICKDCPNYTEVDKDTQFFVCDECGCNMQIKNKYKNTECPLKKF